MSRPSRGMPKKSYAIDDSDDEDFEKPSSSKRKQIKETPEKVAVASTTKPISTLKKSVQSELLSSVTCDECGMDCSKMSFHVAENESDYCPHCYEAKGLENGEEQVASAAVQYEPKIKKAKIESESESGSDAVLESGESSDSDAESFASSESERESKNKMTYKAVSKISAPAPTPSGSAAQKKAFPSAPVRPIATNSSHFISHGSTSNISISRNQPQPSSSSVQAASSIAIPIATASDDITKGPPVNTESQAKKLILQYMKQQNRPYSAIQVYDNLHKRVLKTTVEKVLQTLSEQEDPASGQTILKCKDYGKAKIYFYNQSLLDTLGEQALAHLEKEISTLSSQYKAVEEKCRVVQQQSDRFQAEPTDANLESVLSTTSTRVESKRLKALQLSGGSGVPIDPNARINAIEEFNFYRNVWKNRKGTCIDFLGNFDSGKKLKDIMEDVGIETDEAENVVLPALLPVPTRVQVPRH